MTRPAQLEVEQLIIGGCRTSSKPRRAAAPNAVAATRRSKRRPALRRAAAQRVRRRRNDALVPPGVCGLQAPAPFLEAAAAGDLEGLHRSWPPPSSVSRTGESRAEQRGARAHGKGALPQLQGPDRQRRMAHRTRLFRGISLPARWIRACALRPRYFETAAVLDRIRHFSPELDAAALADLDIALHAGPAGKPASRRSTRERTGTQRRAPRRRRARAASGEGPEPLVRGRARRRSRRRIRPSRAARQPWPGSTICNGSTPTSACTRRRRAADPWHVRSCSRGPIPSLQA